jgi:hypothetical protein
MRRKAMSGDKTFTKYISAEGFISQIYKINSSN